MIGAGTGIAPYRAYLQEREYLGLAGNQWLIFGNQNYSTDYLYQTLSICSQHWVFKYVCCLFNE